jgi:hypothetical protein
MLWNQFVSWMASWSPAFGNVAQSAKDRCLPAPGYGEFPHVLSRFEKVAFFGEALKRPQAFVNFALRYYEAEKSCCQMELLGRIALI